MSGSRAERLALLHGAVSAAATSALGLAYFGFAAARATLTEEDGFLEVTTAVVFGVATLVGVVACFVARGKAGRWNLLLPFAALVGLLDETSFGHRLVGFEPPKLRGFPIDGVHDLFLVAYSVFETDDPVLLSLYALAALGAASIAAWCARPRGPLGAVMRAASRLLAEHPPFRYLAWAAAFVALALVLDLDLVESHWLVFLEELLELQAALALTFGGAAVAVSRRRHGIAIAALLALVAGGSSSVAGTALGQAPISGSDTNTLGPGSGYGKPNQSRVWFNSHAVRWDGLVPRDLGQGSDHYIVKAVAGSRSFTSVELEDRDDARPDVFWDDASRNLYVLGSHASASRLWRVSYSFVSDEYSIDPAVSGVVVPGLVHDVVDGESRPASLYVSPDGGVWVAAGRDRAVLVQHSADGGESWGAAPLALDTTALPAVTVWNHFEQGGVTRLGLFVGEHGAARFRYWSAAAQADPFSPASWTDESNAVPGPLGTETADDHVSAARDAEGNQYFAVASAAGEAGDPRVELLRRTPAGVWSQFPVTTAGELPEQTGPSVVIDGENRRALVYTSSGVGQGLRYEAPLDGLGALATVPPLVLFSAPGTSFDDVIVPRGLVDATSGIAVMAHDETARRVWSSFEIVPPSEAGRVILAGFQSAGPAEFVSLFNTTDQPIPLENLELLVRRDMEGDGDVEVVWRLTDFEPDLAGAVIAPYGFFLVAEAGVPAPGGVHDLEIALDLPTADGGSAERAISIEVLVDDVHMDYVLYGRHDGSNSGAYPPGDLPFDGLSLPRTEVLRNTFSPASFSEGVIERLTPRALHAGHDVPGFYTDEAALGGGFPPGVWWSAHSATYDDYVARNSLSPAVPAACAVDSDGDGTVDCDDADDDDDGVADGSDCAPSEESYWSVPGEVGSLALEELPGTTRVAWGPPAVSGGTALAYDLLLALDAPFAGATCAETTELEEALVPAVPLDNGVFYFLVRATNGCGDGPLGGPSAPSCR